MANQLVKFHESIPVEFYEPAVITRGDARYELIQRTIGNGANDEEMGLFIDLCNSFRLNPFAVGQIYLVPRNTKVPGTSDKWETRYTVQIGVGGLRLLAERTGKMQGIIGPEWCGPDGNWRDVWLFDNPPAAARCGVVRKGHTQPRWTVALWKEFSQWKSGYGGKPDTLTAMWAKFPSYMLGKCAEAAALRGAFPAEMTGVPEVGIDLDEGPRRSQVIDAVVREFVPAAPRVSAPAARVSDLYPTDEPEPAEQQQPAPQRMADDEPTIADFTALAKSLGYTTPKAICAVMGIEPKPSAVDAFSQMGRSVGWGEMQRLLREYAAREDAESQAAATAEPLPFETDGAQGALMDVPAERMAASAARGNH